MIDSILAATDLSARGRLAVKRGAALAAAHGARLTALHVVDQDFPESIRDMLVREAARLPEFGPASGPHDVEIRAGRAHQAIMETAQEVEADLVVIGPHRRDPLQDLLLGGTADRLLRRCACPLLVAKTAPDERPTYRRAVAATDFSMSSRRAIEFACRMMQGGDIGVIHVYQTPSARMFGGETEQAHRQFELMVAEEATAFLSGIARHGARLDFAMRKGAATETILREIEVQRADLLIVGARARTGVAEAILGNTARELIEKSPCDVLAVRAW